MKKQVYQIILVDESLENYHLLQKLCEQLNQTSHFFYKLDYFSTLDLVNNCTDSLFEKVYLIAARQLPSLNCSTLAQLKSCFHSDVIIILVKNFETGILAIEAGATDYLDLTQLTLPALERSLRLTIQLNYTSTHKIHTDFQTEFGNLTYAQDWQAAWEYTKQISSKALSVNSLTQKYLFKNELRHWINFATSLIKDFHNNPYIFDNLEEDEQLSAKLQASKIIYQNIFNHSTDGIFLLSIQPNQQLIYETVNPTYQKIINKKRTEIIGKSIQEVLPSEIAHLLVRQYHTCLDTLIPINYQQTIELGEAIHNWQITLIPIFDEHQQIIKLQGTLRDITEEKSTIATQIHHTRYRHLLRSITLNIRQSLDLETILHTTVTKLQTTLNAERVILIKFLPDQISQIIEEVVVGDFFSLKNKKDLTSDYWQRLGKLSLIKHFYLEQDQNLKHLSVSQQKIIQKYSIRTNLILPIFHRQAVKNTVVKPQPDINHLWGLLSVQQCSQTRQWIEDEIELLQQLVEQLNIAIAQSELLTSEIKQRQELARSNAELEQFAYVASHDLQAPLQTISNYVQLIERRYRKKLDTKADKYINYVIDAVERMRTQINDLLEYSRVGRQKNTLRSTDCNIVLEQAIANLRAEIEQNQAIITCAVNLPTLIADFSQLVVLWQNLIANSIKYRSTLEPLIEIDVQLQDNYWQFSISDNGIGIEPKYQQRIFQIFQRLHTQEEYSGTGIGLAICQKIVQRHGGNIWVQSQLNQGAKFYFTLPDTNH